MRLILTTLLILISTCSFAETKKDFPIFVLNEHFLEKHETHEISDLTEGMGNFVKHLRSRLRGLSAPTPIYLDFGSDSDNSEFRPEPRSVRLGTLNALKNPGLFFVIAAHELGHVSFFEHFIQKTFMEFENILAPRDYFFFVTPYNELYADLISALALEDTEEMKRFVNGTQMREHTAMRRDFQFLPNFKTWNPPAIAADYTLFDPVRGAIWKLLMEQSRPREDSQAILIAFLSATQKHVGQRIRRGETLERQFPTSQLNAEFLSLIVAEAKKGGIAIKGKRLLVPCESVFL